MTKLCFESIINITEDNKNTFLELLPSIEKYIVYRNDIKISLNVDIDEHQVIRRLLRVFNKSIYIALAYITDLEYQVVTDDTGHVIKPYLARLNGKSCKKYVKKRLVIDNRVKDDEYNIDGYSLDFSIDGLVKHNVSIHGDACSIINTINWRS